MEMRITGGQQQQLAPEKFEKGTEAAAAAEGAGSFMELLAGLMGVAPVPSTPAPLTEAGGPEPAAAGPVPSLILPEAALAAAGAAAALPDQEPGAFAAPQSQPALADQPHSPAAPAVLGLPAGGLAAEPESLPVRDAEPAAVPVAVLAEVGSSLPTPELPTPELLTPELLTPELLTPTGSADQGAAAPNPAAGAPVAAGEGDSLVRKTLPGMPDRPISPEQLGEVLGGSVRKAGDNTYAVKLRLYPEQLGEVHLQIKVRQGAVETLLQVATPEAKAALESQASQLRSALDQAGLSLTGFSVSTGNQRDSRPQREFQQGGPFERRAEKRPASAPARLSTYGRQTGSRLDRLA